MDHQQRDEGAGVAGADLIAWVVYGARLVFVGVPLFGAALGFVAFVGAAVLSLVFALLPFAIGLAVIAGVIWLFTEDA